ncbi:MAG TPA: 3-phosphoshikimate 1-carboxyvinyltransferase [Bryobacteraceae bacterium]|nr:3-phosphoshikimate 1-carboxyvinyltransferase [Bryobacteraceae bacterium]
MQQQISAARAVSGTVLLPGDKSISHRYAMLAAIAEGTTKIANYSTGADCQSTLRCVETLGAQVEKLDGVVHVTGHGLDGLIEPAAMLDAGNSGSTIRMLSGILAAQPFVTCIGGDESLSRRPMQRIMQPLAQMGAHIEARDGRFPPLTIHGGNLHPIDYTLPMASAQVKSCVLLAGLFAEGKTTVREPMRTRDHTELALREFGAEVEVAQRVITLSGRPRLEARELRVPGDLSSAAFFLVASLIVPESSLTICGVGLNPTRSALLDFLAEMGAQIKILDVTSAGGELIGDLLVRKSPGSGGVTGGVLEKERTAALIDEIPVLAVLGAASEDGLVVRDAAELRVKETDRIATIAENFKRMGLAITVHGDGFEVPGRQKFHAAELDSFGDHRIAMAFSVAALAAEGPSTILDSDAASVSFPEFFDTLHRVAE